MSKVPLIRHVSYLSQVLHVLLFLGLAAGLYYAGDMRSLKDALFLGAVMYIAYLVVARRVIPRWHRRGIKLVKAGAYSDAIPSFEKSYAFFSNHQWLDSKRYLVLLSSSKISYREMALISIAVSYGQLGEGAKSKEYYEKALKEFPGSILAQTSLNMIKAFESSSK